MGEQTHNLAPPLPSYWVKGGHPSGKGYCLIIANYTNHLHGYRVYVPNITQLFCDTLHFTVHAEENLQKLEMERVLRETQVTIEAEGYAGCLYLYSVTGETQGIQTCNHAGRADETINGRKMYITTEEIVSPAMEAMEGHGRLSQSIFLPNVRRK